MITALVTGATGQLGRTMVKIFCFQCRLAVAFLLYYNTGLSTTKLAAGFTLAAVVNID